MVRLYLVLNFTSLFYVSSGTKEVECLAARPQSLLQVGVLKERLDNSPIQHGLGNGPVGANAQSIASNVNTARNLGEDAANMFCLSIEDQLVLDAEGHPRLLKDIDPNGGRVQIVPIPKGFSGKMVAGMRALLHGGMGLEAPVAGTFFSVIDRRTDTKVFDVAMEDGSHVFASAKHDLLVSDEESLKYSARSIETIHPGNNILKAGGDTTKVSQKSATGTPKIVQSYMTTPVGFLVGTSGVLIPPFGEPPVGSEDFVDLDTMVTLADAWAPHRESLLNEHPCLFQLMGPTWAGRSVMTEVMSEFLRTHPFEADRLDENPELFIEHIKENREGFAAGLLEHCPEDFVT